MRDSSGGKSSGGRKLKFAERISMRLLSACARFKNRKSGWKGENIGCTCRFFNSRISVGIVSVKLVVLKAREGDMAIGCHFDDQVF